MFAAPPRGRHRGDLPVRREGRRSHDPGPVEAGLDRRRLVGARPPPAGHPGDRLDRLRPAPRPGDGALAVEPRPLHSPDGDGRRLDQGAGAARLRRRLPQADHRARPGQARLDRVDRPRGVRGLRQREPGLPVLSLEAHPPVPDRPLRGRAGHQPEPGGALAELPAGISVVLAPQRLAPGLLRHHAAFPAGPERDHRGGRVATCPGRDAARGGDPPLVGRADPDRQRGRLAGRARPAVRSPVRLDRAALSRPGLAEGDRAGMPLARRPRLPFPVVRPAGPHDPVPRPVDPPRRRQVDGRGLVSGRVGPPRRAARRLAPAGRQPLVRPVRQRPTGLARRSSGTRTSTRATGSSAPPGGPTCRRPPSCSTPTRSARSSSATGSRCPGTATPRSSPSSSGRTPRT